MLKVLTTVTNNYLDLFNKYFLSTFPKYIELIINSSDIILDANNLSIDGKPIRLFKQLMYEKILWQRSQIEKYDKIFYIDSDVVFINDFRDDIIERLSHYDIIFQDNNQDYNFGIFALNKSNKILNFFDEVIPEIKNLINKDCSFEEQAILNYYIKKQDLNIGILPLGYFGGHLDKCKFPNFPNEKIYLYHATNTYSMNEKIQVLEYVKNKFKER